MGSCDTSIVSGWSSPTTVIITSAPDVPGCCDCLGGKDAQPLEDVTRWLGDFLLLGFSLMVRLVMAYGRRV